MVHHGERGDLQICCKHNVFFFFYEQKEELRVKKTFRVVREIISPILFE